MKRYKYSRYTQFLLQNMDVPFDYQSVVCVQSLAVFDNDDDPDQEVQRQGCDKLEFEQRADLYHCSLCCGKNYFHRK